MDSIRFKSDAEIGAGGLRLGVGESRQTMKSGDTPEDVLKFPKQEKEPTRKREVEGNEKGNADGVRKAAEPNASDGAPRLFGEEVADVSVKPNLRDGGRQIVQAVEHV